MNHKKPGPPAMAEIVFDIGYLLFALIAGIYLLLHAKGSALITLYGALTLTLGFGDAFHLAPRVYARWTRTMAEHRKALGLGKLVTSVTMTLFYVMLFYVWQLFCGMRAATALTAAVWILAAVRIALCLFPQNGWLKETPPLSWAILRNIPFAILGGVLVRLFWGAGAPFRWMSLAVILSFAFYLVVVLFADKVKPLGALMLPKTVMYIWMICMGFGLL